MRMLLRNNCSVFDEKTHICNIYRHSVYPGVFDFDGKVHKVIFLTIRSYKKGEKMEENGRKTEKTRDIWIYIALNLPEIRI